MSKTKWLTKAEYAHFMGLVVDGKNLRDELLFRLMGEAGLRVGEVVGGAYTGSWTVLSGEKRSSRTKLPGLKRKDRMPPKHIKVLGKGTKYRIVPVPARVVTLLDALEPQGGPADRYVGIGYTMVRKLIHKYVWKDLDFEEIHGSGEEKLTSHWFRHTFAMHYLEDGGDIRVLQELLGHTDLNETMIYAKLRGGGMVESDWDRVQRTREAKEAVQ